MDFLGGFFCTKIGVKLLRLSGPANFLGFNIQNTPSPRVTRILVPEKPRVMRKPRNAGTWCIV